MLRVTATKSSDLDPALLALEQRLQQGQREAGRVVGKIGRKAILDNAKTRRGGLRMMGGRLGVGVKVDASTTSSLVTFAAKPAGPWAIVERGTKAHTVKPKRADVLAIAKGDVIGLHANIPRQAGTRLWTRSTNDLDRQIKPALQDVFDDALGTR